MVFSRLRSIAVITKDEVMKIRLIYCNLTIYVKLPKVTYPIKVALKIVKRISGMFFNRKDVYMPKK